MNPKITIIIPVYNAENYLSNTIDSIINQSIGFENLELILIDDNSTDNSWKIINSYANSYDNIKPFFNKTNHGFPGFSRNIGISNAQGKYIMFADNDDEYDKDFCKTMFELIESKDADFAACCFFETDALTQKKVCPPKGLFTKKEDIIANCGCMVWNKIYKSEIAKQISFITDGLNEDSIFLIEYSLKADSLASINSYTGYNHLYRSKSLSLSSVSSTLSQIDSFYILYNLLNPDYLKPDYFNTSIQLTLERCILGEGSVKQNREILKKLKEFENHIGYSSQISSKPINILNNLVLNNHLLTVALITRFLRPIANNSFLRKVFRNLNGQ